MISPFSHPGEPRLMHLSCISNYEVEMKEEEEENGEKEGNVAGRAGSYYAFTLRIQWDGPRNPPWEALETHQK